MKTAAVLRVEILRQDSDLESSNNPESGSESTIDQNHQTMD